MRRIGNERAVRSLQPDEATFHPRKPSLVPHAGGTCAGPRTAAVGAGGVDVGRGPHAGGVAARSVAGGCGSFTDGRVTGGGGDSGSGSRGCVAAADAGG